MPFAVSPGPESDSVQFDMRTSERGNQCEKPYTKANRSPDSCKSGLLIGAQLQSQFKSQLQQVIQIRQIDTNLRGDL